MSIRHGWLVGSALLLCAHVAGADQVLKTIQVGGAPTFAVSTTDGTRVYIGNAATADLSVIDTATDSVVTTIPLPHNEGTIEAIHLAITPDGTLLYAVDENVTAPGTVNVVSTATNAIVATLDVDRRPTAIAVRPDGREVYVVNHDGGSISVITAVDYQLATVPLDGGSPSAPIAGART
jgi:YVTN family beta-propeller protein